MGSVPSSVGGHRGGKKGTQPPSVKWARWVAPSPMCSGPSFILCGQGRCWRFLPHRAVVRKDGASVGAQPRAFRGVAYSLHKWSFLGLWPWASHSPCSSLHFPEWKTDCSWYKDTQREPVVKRLIVVWGQEGQGSQLALCCLGWWPGHLTSLSLLLPPPLKDMADCPCVAGSW